MNTDVDASDALRRILWRHRWLVIALTLIPIAVVVPLLRAQPVLYAATANLQAQAAVPDADTQVLGIVGRVSAVATNPDVVQQAITSAGVDRDAVATARQHITASSVGSSGVVAVTVTDRSSAVALAVSRALANAVVESLNGLGPDATGQLAALAAQESSLTARRDSLLQQLTQAQATHLQVTDAGVQALITELNAVETQLSNNITATQQLQATDSAKAGAGVVSSPSFATKASRQLTGYAALASLLGLILALLVASSRELIRPTVAEPAAAGRELGLVLLGDAYVGKDGPALPEPDLVSRVDIAADRIGAGTLVLTGPLPVRTLAALAESLGLAVRADDTQHAGTRQIGLGSRGRPHSLVVTTMADIQLHSRPDDPALVLILPRFAPRAALDQVSDLALATGWPLLGVVGTRRLGRRRRRKIRRTEATSGAGVTPHLSVAGTKDEPDKDKDPATRTLLITPARAVDGGSGQGSAAGGGSDRRDGLADRTGTGR